MSDNNFGTLSLRLMPLIENSPSQISEANEPPGFDTTSLKNNLTLPAAPFYFFFVITPHPPAPPTPTNHPLWLPPTTPALLTLPDTFVAIPRPPIPFATPPPPQHHPSPQSSTPPTHPFPHPLAAAPCTPLHYFHLELVCEARNSKLLLLLPP